MQTLATPFTSRKSQHAASTFRMTRPGITTACDVWGVEVECARGFVSFSPVSPVSGPWPRRRSSHGRRRAVEPKLQSNLGRSRPRAGSVGSAADSAVGQRTDVANDGTGTKTSHRLAGVEVLETKLPKQPPDAASLLLRRAIHLLNLHRRLSSYICQRRTCADAFLSTEATPFTMITNASASCGQVFRAHSERHRRHVP